MTLKKNILIVVQAKVGLTETFIQAHIDGLDGNIHYLYGYNLSYYTENDVSLKEIYQPRETWKDKLEKLLPHHFYFKITYLFKEWEILSV
jgi:hypothetical protein